jgi:chromosome segregation ATPase
VPIRINELEERRSTRGVCPCCRKRERATAEDGLQAKLDEQVRARERLEEEVNQMRNILNQSHDQARMFCDELEATKKKATERLAKNRKQYEERLRVQKAVAQRAATALTQLETVSHTDAAELLSSLMARQEQDEKVTSLSKEINEAMAEVEEQRSVKEKLQQQYDSLRGQYTHREEQNKRKIASLSRDLKEESRQLKVALAEGEELRDAASQLNHHRRPQGESRCNDPEHLCIWRASWRPPSSILAMCKLTLTRRRGAALT